MSNDNVAIKIQDVSKYFSPSVGQQTIKQFITRQIKKDKKHLHDGYWAVKNINFEVNKGDFFGIVGRNGSGKSTLLKMIAGVYAPTEGAITVNGKLVPFIELGVGFNSELSGRDNVFLNGALLGFSRSEMEAMYDEIVAFAELEDHMEKKLKNYSSGMQVRLAFSIAIRANSDIILLDEVLAVGDALFQQKCFDYFNELKKQRKTVVFVSHDMDALKKHCSRAIYIRDGEVVKVGTINEVADLYNIDMLEELEKDQAKPDGHTELSRQIEITKIRVLDAYGKVTKRFAQDEMITIECTYRANVDVSAPIFGITLFPRNSDTPIFGVNTVNPVNITQATKIMKSGTDAKMIIKLQNRFSEGIYVMTPAVADSSGLIAYDKKERINAFASTKTKNNFAYFQSTYEISLEGL